MYQISIVALDCFELRMDIFNQFFYLFDECIIDNFKLLFSLSKLLILLSFAADTLTILIYSINNFYKKLF